MRNDIMLRWWVPMAVWCSSRDSFLAGWLQASSQVIVIPSEVYVAVLRIETIVGHPLGGGVLARRNLFTQLRASKDIPCYPFHLLLLLMVWHCDWMGMRRRGDLGQSPFHCGVAFPSAPPPPLLTYYQY